MTRARAPAAVRARRIRPMTGVDLVTDIGASLAGRRSARMFGRDALADDHDTQGHDEGQGHLDIATESRSSSVEPTSSSDGGRRFCDPSR